MWITDNAARKSWVKKRMMLAGFLKVKVIVQG